MIWLALLGACTSGDGSAPATSTSAQTTVVTSSADTGVTGKTEETPAFQSAVFCAECHPNQYEEWRRSMHAYAAKSPPFDVLSAKVYRDSAGETGSFCTRCHSPFGAAEGENGAITAGGRSEMSLESVSCDYCHTATGHDGQIGNREIISEPGPLKLGSFDDPVATDAHESENSDFVTGPTFCGSCHDVYKYPGVNFEQTYTEWLESPAATEGTRCQDCHMSPEPGVAGGREWGPAAVVEGETFPDRELSSHTFIGPDYALIDDFPYPDDLEASAVAQAEHLQSIETLLKNSVKIASVETTNEGSDLRVAVVLESLTAGHRMPTGFTSERQLWIHLTISDPMLGTVLYESGDLDSDGNLRDEHSHDVILGTASLDEDLVNLQSRAVVIKRTHIDNGALLSNDDSRFETTTIFPQDAESIVRYSLEPLEQREFVYVIPGVSSAYTLTAELRYRNLPPYIFQALGADALLDRLQIFTIDTVTEEG